MNEQPQDLKPRTKAFALPVIKMYSYSKLAKNDTVAQMLAALEALKKSLPHQAFTGEL